MDNEVKEKLEHTKSNGVWMRILVPKRTHRRLKSFNLSQPKETIAKSAVRLIEKSLELAAPAQP
jgi:hypothetical protein